MHTIHDNDGEQAEVGHAAKRTDLIAKKQNRYLPACGTDKGVIDTSIIADNR